MFKKIKKGIKRYLEAILISGIILPLFAIAVGYIKLNIFPQYLYFLSFLSDYSKIFFNVSIFFALCFLYFKIYKINKKLKVAFTEKFNKDLHENWDFTGDWQIEDGDLSVTDSGNGGISKIGSLWENYEFEFKTKIVNEFSGWIIRAQDLNNYFMFQINFKNIRPHLKLSQPIISKNEKGDFEIKEEKVGWRLYGNFPHHKDLKDKWFTVKTVVRGSRVDIFINGDNVFHRDNFLTIPIGKVGFRECGNEHAHFRNIKVKMVD